MGVYIKYSRHALSIMLSNMISIKSCKPFSRFACLLIIDANQGFKLTNYAISSAELASVKVN